MGNHGNHFSEPPDMRVAGGLSGNCVWSLTYLRSDTYLRFCADLKTMVGLSCSHDDASPTETQEDPRGEGETMILTPLQPLPMFELVSRRTS